MMRAARLYPKRDVKDAVILISPLVFLAAAFVLIPVAGTVVTSLLRAVSYLPQAFVGLDNYRKLLSDPLFWQSVRFTLLFVLVSVSLELPAGLAFALILDKRSRWQWLLRALILVPWAVPAVVSARSWQLMLHYDLGLVNELALRLGIVSSPVNWLGSPSGAFFSLLVADVWKTTPFVTIICLAGLAAIPKDLYMQAAVDGANFLQRFLMVTLPLMKPFLVVALLFRMIDALRIFDVIYVITGGGPGGQTTSLSLYAYGYFLGGDFGYGSSVSVIIFLIAAGLAFLLIRLSRFSEIIR